MENEEQVQPPKKSKRWLLRYPQKLILDVVFAFFFLLVIELGARIFFVEDLEKWEAPLPSFHQRNRVLQGNPYLIFEYTPGIWNEKGIQIRINSLGLRGPEITIPKPEGVRRLLTVGDSAVFGFGVSEETVFSQVAANILNEQNTEVKIESINGAIPGYSTVQSINLLELRTWQTDPDLVVVGSIASDSNYGNFVDKNLIASLMKQEQGRIAQLHRFMTFSAAYRVADWRRRVRVHANRIKEIGNQIYATNPSGVRRVAINDYAKNLDFIIDSARKRGAEVVLVMPANENDITKRIRAKHPLDPYRKVMRETAKRHRVPLLSMVEVFQESRYPSKKLFLDPVHPSAFGHRILGAALAEILKDWSAKKRINGERTRDKRPIYKDEFAK